MSAPLGCAILATALLVTSGAAAELRVPLMKRAPVINGRIDPGEWKVSAGFEGFQYGGKLQQRRAQGYVGATRDSIFVAIRSQLPDEGRLVANVTADSLKAVYDDSVEVYVGPAPGSDARVTYQFLVNSLGKGGYTVHLLGGAKEEVSWQGGWKHAHGIHDGHWHFECRVPVASMGAGKGRKTTDGVWGVNLTRNWKDPWEWSSLSGGYQDPLCLFRFVDRGAPAVHYFASRDPFQTNFTGEMTLHNPSRATMSLAASLVLERNRMPALRKEERVVLAAGGTKRVTLKVPQDDATTLFDLKTSVRSSSGDAVFYDRATSWPKAKPYRWVSADKKKVLPVDFRFAYYPYRNRMRIVADISGLPRGARAESVVATIRKKGRGRAVKTISMPVEGFKDGRQEIVAELPPLEGSYEIALRVRGQKVPEGEIVKEFDRKVFPWEHTKLGTSTKVYPPFTPIEVRRRTLKTVLREHSLNGLGLWDQVEATSSHTGVTKSILAEPMRFVVKLDGRRTRVTPGRLRFTSRRAHEAKVEGGFGAGGLKARVKNTWDYDGMVKVELTLEPTAGARLDELTLEIPFRSEAATHIHANSDRIRAPVAMRIPEEEGVAWDGSKVACDEFIKNFCPYVYVGTPVRGICWFAENDLGWSWDPGTPNVDVSREGDKVFLRVHLVNKPVVIGSPRTITFGLQAAPVKPRLSPGGPNWWRYRFARDRYSLLGTDINWLALGNCGSVYPAGRDMYLWEMIARGNKERLSDAEIQSVVDRGRPYFEPYGEEPVESFVRHAWHNLRSRYGHTMVFYYNRASYQAAEEFQVFEDEWCLTDMRSVGKGNGRGEIKIVPSKSYIDHALYWYAKSFEIGGNKGVYWDNFFIGPSFNTQMTDAYRRPDGSIVPAAGIWTLRELCKRTFILMNERGMLPITFPHMTSFSPLPMMAFATVQFDWEWKYSMGEVQDRFTRELILMTSTGEQAGVWPMPLWDHGPQTEDPWIQRTFRAVRQVHELDGAPFEPVLKLLDKPGLEVYRYWDERPQPVRTQNPDLPTIVYSVPGDEAVAALVSYSAADEDVRLSVDLSALGFEKGCKVTDAESGKPVALDRFGAGRGRITLRLKKHDIRLFRFTNGGRP